MSKLNTYNSRTYHIWVEEFDNGTAFAEIQCKRIYKHGAFRWLKKHKKKYNPEKHKTFAFSHCLIDYARDYGDYFDCLDKLSHSKCARRWFTKIMKRYVDEYFSKDNDYR